MNTSLFAGYEFDTASQKDKIVENLFAQTTNSDNNGPSMALTAENLELINEQHQQQPTTLCRNPNDRYKFNDDTTADDTNNILDLVFNAPNDDFDPIVDSPTPNDSNIQVIVINDDNNEEEEEKGYEEVIRDAVGDAMISACNTAYLRNAEMMDLMDQDYMKSTNRVATKFPKLVTSMKKGYTDCSKEYDVDMDPSIEEDRTGMTVTSVGNNRGDPTGLLPRLEELFTGTIKCDLVLDTIVKIANDTMAAKLDMLPGLKKPINQRYYWGFGTDRAKELGEDMEVMHDYVDQLEEKDKKNKSSALKWRNKAVKAEVEAEELKKVAIKYKKQYDDSVMPGYMSSAKSALGSAKKDAERYRKMVEDKDQEIAALNKELKSLKEKLDHERANNISLVKALEVENIERKKQQSLKDLSWENELAINRELGESIQDIMILEAMLTPEQRVQFEKIRNNGPAKIIAKKNKTTGNNM